MEDGLTTINCTSLQTDVALLDNNPDMNDIERQIFAAIQEVTIKENPSLASDGLQEDLCEKGRQLLSQLLTKSKPQQSMADVEAWILRKLQLPQIFQLSVSDAQGASVPLRSYLHQGRIVVIVFWATWCIPCLSEIPELNRLVAQYPEQVSVVSIALQSASEFAEAFGRLQGSGVEAPRYPIFFDPDRLSYESVDRSSQDISIPYTIYYTPDGIFRGDKRGTAMTLMQDGSLVPTPNALIHQIEGLFSDL